MWTGREVILLHLKPAIHIEDQNIFCVQVSTVLDFAARFEGTVRNTSCTKIFTAAFVIEVD